MAFTVVSNFIRIASLHVLFLVETKCNDFFTNKLKVSLNFSGCFTINSAGLSGGLCLLWKDSVDVTIHFFSLHHINSFVLWDVFAWRFTSFYGHPVKHKRVHTWELLGVLP